MNVSTIGKIVTVSLAFSLFFTLLATFLFWNAYSDKAFFALELTKLFLAFLVASLFQTAALRYLNV